MVQAQCPAAHQQKVRRLIEFCPQFDDPVVPDPYYGGDQGFERVLDLVEDACDGLIRHIEQQRKLHVKQEHHGRHETT